MVLVCNYSKPCSPCVCVGCALLLYMFGYGRCVAAMLRSALTMGLTTQKAVLKYIGERFRLKSDLTDWVSDEDVARYLLK